MPSVISAGTTAGTAVNISGDTTGNLAFQTNGTTTAMTITNAQNVGIGTTTPAVNLTVNGSSNPQIAVTSPAGTGAFVTIAAGGTTINGTSFDLVQDSSGTGYVYNRSNANLIFGANNVERMRITPAGNVGIGTTGPTQKLVVAGGAFIYDGGSNYSGTLSVGNTNSGDSRPLFLENQNTGATSNGMIYINNYRNNTDFSFLQCWANNSGSQRAFIAGSGTFGSATGVYGGTSDVRIKTNIVDATPKLAKLMQVRVVNYNRTDQDDAPKELGVIAQELETVFPGLVFEEEVKKADGTVICPDRKHVKYSVFVPMLIKAMQEQQAMINELKAEVAALKGAQ